MLKYNCYAWLEWFFLMIKNIPFVSTLLPTTILTEQGHSPFIGRKWKCQQNNKYTRNFLQGNRNCKKDRAYYFKICSASAFAVMFRLILAGQLQVAVKLLTEKNHYSWSRLWIFNFLVYLLLLLLLLFVLPNIKYEHSQVCLFSFLHFFTFL